MPPESEYNTPDRERLFWEVSSPPFCQQPVQKFAYPTLNVRREQKDIKRGLCFHTWENGVKMYFMVLDEKSLQISLGSLFYSPASRLPLFHSVFIALFLSLRSYVYISKHTNSRIQNTHLHKVNILFRLLCLQSVWTFYDINTCATVKCGCKNKKQKRLNDHSETCSQWQPRCYLT